MAWFKKELPEKNFSIKFDSKYVANLIEMVRQAPGKYVPTLSLEFPEKTCQDVDDSISMHQSIGNVLYTEDKQFLDVVGESFHTDAIKIVVDAVGLENWMAGFLLPEPLNPFDSNAVSVVLIWKHKNDTEYNCQIVGYLAKEQAKKVHKKIVKCLESDGVIPVLAMIKGGTPDQPNFGLLVRAMTDAVKF
jgi:hypothetical protein